MIRCEGKRCLIRKKCARWSTDLGHFAWVEEMYDVMTASCEMFVDREELAEVQK